MNGHDNRRHGFGFHENIRYGYERNDQDNARMDFEPHGGLVVIDIVQEPYKPPSEDPN